MSMASVVALRAATYSDTSACNRSIRPMILGSFKSLLANPSFSTACSAAPLMRATCIGSLKTKYRHVAVRASLNAELASLRSASVGATFGIKLNSSEFTS